MAEGDMTMSTATYCEGMAAVKSAVDALTLTLSGIADQVHVTPVPGRDDCYAVYKIEREQ